MDDIGHHAPDMHIFALCDIELGVVRVLGGEQDAPLAPHEPLHGQLPVQSGDDHAVVPGLDGAVHDEQVAVMDARPKHGIALRSQKKRGGAVMDEVLVEVEPPVHIVLGRRRETRLHRGKVQGQALAARRGGRRRAEELKMGGKADILHTAMIQGEGLRGKCFLRREGG